MQCATSRGESRRERGPLAVSHSADMRTEVPEGDGFPEFASQEPSSSAAGCACSATSVDSQGSAPRVGNERSHRTAHCASHVLTCDEAVKLLKESQLFEKGETQSKPRSPSSGEDLCFTVRVSILRKTVHGRASPKGYEYLGFEPAASSGKVLGALPEHSNRHNRRPQRVPSHFPDPREHVCPAPRDTSMIPSIPMTTDTATQTTAAGLDGE